MSDETGETQIRNVLCDIAVIQLVVSVKRVAVRHTTGMKVPNQIKVFTYGVVSTMSPG